MNEDNITFENLSMGAKAISYAAQLLALCGSVAIACSFSSVWIGLIVLVISTVVLVMLACLAAMFVTVRMSTAHVAFVGATTHSVLFKLGNLFAKKVAA